MNFFVNYLLFSIRKSVTDISFCRACCIIEVYTRDFKYFKKFSSNNKRNNIFLLFGLLLCFWQYLVFNLWYTHFLCLLPSGKAEDIMSSGRKKLRKSQKLRKYESVIRKCESVKSSDCENIS